jgi:hypothetical protein
MAAPSWASFAGFPPQVAPLLKLSDHLVGAGEEGQRHGQADGLGVRDS